MKLSVLGAIICAAGCSNSSPPPASTGAPPTSSGTVVPVASPDPVPTSTAVEPPVEPAPAAHKFVGSWTSPSCGVRTYQRRLTLGEGGKASGQELVSPCPPTTQCVWSGIVDWAGTFTAEGDRIRFAVSAMGGLKGKVLLPTELWWDSNTGELAEKDGDTRCAYERAASKPEAR